MNKYKEDLEMFGENNESKYVVASSIVTITTVALVLGIIIYAFIKL